MLRRPQIESFYTKQHGTLNNRYTLSFTASSLRPELARIVAEAYLDCGDWGRAKQRILEQNSLQARTVSSGIRMEREIRQRVQTLTRPQIEILASAPADSRAALAWLSALKSSAFVFDFAAEVLRTKLEALDPDLRPSDYETFYFGKCAAHPELVAIKTTTQAKIKRVLFTMLREAGILIPSSPSATVCRPVVPHDVLTAIIADDRRWLAGFLLPDTEISLLRGSRHGV